MIERASPVEMRKALRLVDEMTKAGILFVPIPVLNKSEQIEQQQLMINKLQAIEDKNK